MLIIALLVLNNAIWIGPFICLDWYVTLDYHFYHILKLVQPHSVNRACCYTFTTLYKIDDRTLMERGRGWGMCLLYPHSNTIQALFHSRFL